MARRRPDDVPKYPFGEVIRLAGTPGRRHLTEEAEDDAWNKLSLRREAIFKIVASLNEAVDFYTWLPADNFPGEFQDVYHAFGRTPRYPRGVLIYCKVQVIRDELTVISFKPKDER